MFTLYTPQTANKALPEVKRMFAAIVAQKNKAVALSQELVGAQPEARLMAAMSTIASILICSVHATSPLARRFTPP